MGVQNSSIMKNYTIPVILSVTILVAGIFAMMPVEDASTVHTTLAANIDKQDRSISYSFSTGATLISDAINANILPFKLDAWQGSANVIVSDGAGTCLVNEVADGGTETDGTEAAGASQTGVGSSDANPFPANMDRLHVVIGANMDCTVVVFLDESNE